MYIPSAQWEEKVCVSYNLEETENSKKRTPLLNLGAQILTRIKTKYWIREFSENFCRNFGLRPQSKQKQSFEVELLIKNENFEDALSIWIFKLILR